MVAILVALGIDNVGSGLFLPLTLVYATRVVGLPLAVAGVTVTAGTVVGLLVPPMAGRIVDRVGPRPVVIASQVVQALGALGYAVADGVGTVAVAVCLLAAGQQLFYSALFALLADVVGDRAKDRPFAVVGMVRAGCFGLGALVAAWLLTVGALRLAVLLDAASFVVCAFLLVFFVRAPHASAPSAEDGRVSRRFLFLISATAVVALGLDFFLVGIPVYVLGLGAPSWLPGVVLALHTLVTSTCGTLGVAARLADRGDRGDGGERAVLRRAGERVGRRPGARGHARAASRGVPVRVHRPPGGGAGGGRAVRPRRVGAVGGGRRVCRCWGVRLSVGGFSPVHPSQCASSVKDLWNSGAIGARRSG